MAEINLI